jgi:hypothetical protein
MADTLLPCPACRTTLRVPDDMRGKVITCLECRALLLAPQAGSGEPLTVVPKVAARGGFPPRVFVALAALILLGFAGVVVNGYTAYQFSTDPAAAERYAHSLLEQMAGVQMFGAPKKKDLTEEEKAEALATRQKQAQALAEARGEDMKRASYLFAAVSFVVLCGGLAFAFRTPYWLAWLGCLAAILNINHGCCFPGAIAAVWSAAILISTDGRRYFGKDDSTSPARDGV